MASITEIAAKFFEACETGKGWDGCKAYCKPNATFSAQAEPLADVRTLQQYTDWMKAVLTFIPDGRYELRSFATDDKGKSVCAYGRLLRHAHRRRWTLRTDWQEHEDGLCVCDGF